MEKIRIGKIATTHGIKGELKIISDFPYKDKIFKVGNTLLIDNMPYQIKTYRPHKQFDMVTLNDYKDINEVLFLVKKPVYFDKELLTLEDDEILDKDLITYKVLTTEGKEGIIKEIFLASPKNKILRIFIEKELLIPLNSPLIKELDKKNKIIKIELIPGL